eukprot:360309-Chlamydomonas_euryale.AAC.5
MPKAVACMQRPKMRWKPVECMQGRQRRQKCHNSSRRTGVPSQGCCPAVGRGCTPRPHVLGRPWKVATWAVHPGAREPCDHQGCAWSMLDV